MHDGRGQGIEDAGVGRERRAVGRGGGAFPQQRGDAQVWAVDEHVAQIDVTGAGGGRVEHGAVGVFVTLERWVPANRPGVPLADETGKVVDVVPIATRHALGFVVLIRDRQIRVATETVGGGERDALKIGVLMRLRGTLAVPHAHHAEREPILEQHAVHVDGGALGALAGDLEVEGGEILGETRGAGAEIQVTTGAAGAEEDGIGTAGGAHALDVVGVGFAGGAEAVGRKRGAEAAGTERKSLGEIARLVAGAAGFAIAEGHLGAQIVAQDFLHRGRAEIVEQVLGENTDRGGRVAQRRVEPTAFQRVGGGIPRVGLRRDDEGREFNDLFFGGGRRRGCGGKNDTGQERGQGHAAQARSGRVHGIFSECGVFSVGGEITLKILGFSHLGGAELGRR